MFFFYKFLARKPEVDAQKNKLSRLKMLVPDTPVINDIVPPCWIYTSVEGYVYKYVALSSCHCRTEYFTDKHAASKFCESSNMDEVVAI